MDSIKKNWFWIVSGIVALAMIGIWYWQAGSLAGMQAKNEAMIETNTKDAKNIMTKSIEIVANGEDVNPVAAHANSKTIEGMESEISSAAASLVRAWDIRYNAQNKIMQWPDEVQRSPDFGPTFKRFNPPEKYSMAEVENPNSLLINYQTKIPMRMAALCKRFSTQWNFGKTAEQIAAELPPVVRWEKKNQELWNEKLTNFKREGNNSESPNTFQVFATQQDLWLLEAVFGVIKTVNGAADANDLAPIKKIEHIVFGRDAQTTAGQTLTTINKGLVDRVSGGGGMDGIPGGGAGGKKGMTAGNDGEAEASTFTGRDMANMSMGSSSNAAPDGFQLLTPFHNRYVDSKLNPISIDKLQAALKSTELPDDNLESVIAKRVPFRVALRMNETKIPQMIAAFGTPSTSILGADDEQAKTEDYDYSGFNFEIMQVRINCADDYGDFGSVKDAGNKSNKGGSGKTIGAIDGGGNEAAQQAAAAAAGEEIGPINKDNIELRKNFDVDVEFYGIVKIYNPVEPNRFKSKGEQMADSNDSTPAPNPDSKTSQTTNVADNRKPS